MDQLQVIATTVEDGAPPRRRRRLRAALATLALIAGVVGVGASPAHAATGAVGGTVRCSWAPWGPKVSGLWTWTNTNGGRWDRYSNTQTAAGWGRDLSKIPSGGQLLHYDLYCNGRLAPFSALR